MGCWSQAGSGLPAIAGRSSKAMPLGEVWEVGGALEKRRQLDPIYKAIIVCISEAENTDYSMSLRFSTLVVLVARL